MLVARALKIGQIADGDMPPTDETMHWRQFLQIPGVKTPGCLAPATNPLVVLQEPPMRKAFTIVLVIVLVLVIDP